VLRLKDGNYQEDIDLPKISRPLLSILVDTLEALNARIRLLEAQIAQHAREGEICQKLTTIPGIGPTIATAIAALAHPFQHLDGGATLRCRAGSTPLA